MVKALILVDSGPPGLELDMPTPAKFTDAEKAYDAGDLDLVAEIETQIWFDGVGRTSAQVNQAMRKLVYEMDRNALSLEVKQLGKRLPDTQVPAVDRLNELLIPVLVIVGVYDTPYMQAAANYMSEKIPSAQKVIIDDAAHLPNLDHPAKFQHSVSSFLEGLPN
jgi:3-oxoadipate enol-lactonase